MPLHCSYDAVVVGSGPNGLSAAVLLAMQKLKVLLVEGGDSIGGGMRSGELTLPGFVHDICSAVYPFFQSSPFLGKLPLATYGLRWIRPEVSLAHPLEDGRAILVSDSVEATAAGLGADRGAYKQLIEPLVERWSVLQPELLAPLLRIPRHPLALARFGILGLRSAAGLTRGRFRGDAASALFAGMSAHSFLPLEAPGSAAFGLVLAVAAHTGGWPFAQGGAQNVSNAIAAHFRALGGEIALGVTVRNVDELPLARAVLLDVTPRQLLKLAGHKLPESYVERLKRYRYGPGVFKVDYALDAPVPWRATGCARAGTVHLGGSAEEIIASEAQIADGKIPEKPFVLFAQPTLFDAARAPVGKHIAWAYCHVPNGSSADMTEAIERQIERFAPDFRKTILARRTIHCAQLEAHNPNMAGGDISGGANDLLQLLARPVLSRAPYRTPVPGLYLCSASTPPGGGVHGMCGFHAARTALQDCFRK